MRNKEAAIKPIRIGIVGAGFSGTALAALLLRSKNQPMEIFLFEQSGEFGAGDAYRTPYSWHILNVRARDMSAFEDDPQNFINWVEANRHLCGDLEPNLPLGEQFLSRSVYRHYLQSLISQHSPFNAQVVLHQVAAKVVDIKMTNQQGDLILEDGHQYSVDKVVLALGNNAPSPYSFSIDDSVRSIDNPWNYQAVKQIAKDDSVIIMGTGLSMIDAVLTLSKQGHRGKVYAVSRRGLLPLAHAESHVHFAFDRVAMTPGIRKQFRAIRSISRDYMQEGGDWRSIINAMRHSLPDIWMKTSLDDKKRFMRHVLPYWNIHRHRVHHKLTAVLNEMQHDGQLQVLAGRVQQLKNGIASIQLKKTDHIQEVEVNWLINCIGSAPYKVKNIQPLLASLVDEGFASLDPLGLGLAINKDYQLQQGNGRGSSVFYALGPLIRGALWECTAVPEIRLQCKQIAKHILSSSNELREYHANTSSSTSE